MSNDKIIKSKSFLGIWFIMLFYLFIFIANCMWELEDDLPKRSFCWDIEISDVDNSTVIFYVFFYFNVVVEVTSAEVWWPILVGVFKTL